MRLSIRAAALHSKPVGRQRCLRKPGLPSVASDRNNMIAKFMFL